MKSSELFPSKYLRALDLKGTEPILTIALVAMEELNDGHKPIIYFEGKNKGVVLNRTNCAMLEFLFGDETDGWAGHKIQLFAAMTTDPSGKPVLGLRVKAAPGNGGSAPAHQHVMQDRGTYKVSGMLATNQVELPDDEIPF
jgi:hypothetical protein